MVRRLGFAVVVVTAFIVAACGRQVTPNPPNFSSGGAPTGFMSVKFDVAAPFNFQTYQYWIVFNTSGNGTSPDCVPNRNNYAGYNFGLESSGGGGVTGAVPYQFVKNPNPVVPPQLLRLNPVAQQFQYLFNSNGTGTEFTILFQRQLFSGVNPSPSPHASPSSSPQPFASHWLFNILVTQPNNGGQLVCVDSMGQGGATDTTWHSPVLDINSSFDQVFYKIQDINPPSDPAAQIVSAEIANNP